VNAAHRWHNYEIRQPYTTRGRNEKLDEITIGMRQEQDVFVINWVTDEEAENI
jgi:hypothetical protein